MDFFSFLASYIGKVTLASYGTFLKEIKVMLSLGFLVARISSSLFVVRIVRMFKPAAKSVAQSPNVLFGCSV